MTLLIIAIVLALLFDFLNGMNDAANSVATIVSTRVLSPRLAVVWATVFNFVAVFIFGVHVAETMGRGIVNPAIIDVPMILVTLISAIIWTHACTQMGFPISVSHALVGGLVGAGVAKAGFGVVVVSGVAKVVLFIAAAGPVPRLRVHDRGLLDLPAQHAAPHGPLVPQAAACFGRLLQHGARRE